ncbi:MAG: hypothetical protein OIF34_10580, partial [Porticoccaceae bacterium]|nr:hypothetical protein [Porticoccaceae bacterium]
MRKAEIGYWRRLQRIRQSRNPDELDREADSNDCFVRFAVADNFYTASHTLARLVDDRRWYWRCARLIALHPATSHATLQQLALHKLEEVRWLVAERPDLN